MNNSRPRRGGSSKPALAIYGIHGILQPLGRRATLVFGIALRRLARVLVGRLRQASFVLLGVYYLVMVVKIKPRNSV